VLRDEGFNLPGRESAPARYVDVFDSASSAFVGQPPAGNT
jgi:hypothetical protein